MKKILVTGGTGFIGKHLVDKLEEDINNKVFVSDHKSWDLTLGTPDFREPIDEIYHLASAIGTKELVPDPYKTLIANMSMMANIISISKKYSSKVLFVSTADVFYMPQSDTVEDRWVYGFSKRVCEVMLMKSGVDYRIARLSNVYGPGMNERYVIGNFIKRIKNGENPLVVASAEDTRRFTYVEDVARLLIYLMDTKQPITHITSKEEITISELAKTIIKILESNTKTEDFKSKSLELRPLPPDHYIFGPTSLITGLRQTIAFYEQKEK